MSDRESSMLKVIMDTDILPLDALRVQIGDVPVDIAVMSVTSREVESASFATERRHTPHRRRASRVGGARFDQAVWSSAKQRALA